MKREGRIKCDSIHGFQMFELIRSTKNGGGMAIGACNEMEPAFISEGNDETEVLVIEVKLNGFQVRCINGYGPQENDLTENWDRIGVEIENCVQNEKGIIFQMYGNLHAGPELLPGDPMNVTPMESCSNCS